MGFFSSIKNVIGQVDPHTRAQSTTPPPPTVAPAPPPAPKPQGSSFTPAGRPPLLLNPFAPSFAKQFDPNVQLQQAQQNTTSLVAQARQADAQVASLKSAPAGSPARADLNEAQSQANQLWAQARASAAQEMKLVARLHPDQAAQAIDARHDVLASQFAKDPKMTAVIDGARDDVKVSRASDAVEEAMKHGPDAGAQELANQVNALPPALANRLVSESPQVGAILDSVSKSSRKVDGGDPVFDQKTAKFDATIASLADVYSKVSGPARDKIADGLVSEISQHGVGALDESLGRTLAVGKDADLAMDVVEKLDKQGKTKEANDVLQNLKDDGLGGLQKQFNELSDKVDKDQQELSFLVQTNGPFMTSDQLQKSIQGYKDSHPEMAELDQLGNQMVRISNRLTSLPGDLGNLSNAQKLSDANDKFLEKNVDKLAQFSPSAMQSIADFGLKHNEVAGAEKPEGEEQKDIFTKITELKERGELGKKADDFMGKDATQVVSSTMDKASEALNQGDTAGAQKILDGLKSKASLLGVDEKKFGEVVDGLKTAANPALDQAGKTAALTDVNKKLDELGGDETQVFGQSNVAQFLRAGGVVLALAGTPGQIKEALKSGDPLQIAQSFNQAVGATKETGELIAGLVGKADSFEALGSALGTFTSVAGAAINFGQALQSVGDGDFAKGGLFAAQGVGALLLLGDTTGPAGIAIGIAATLAMQQLDHVRASNVHENAANEKFLTDAGVSKGVANHLIDADADGHSPMPVFLALANKLNVPPTQMLNFLNTLPPDRVLAFVHQAHGVDPDKDGHFADTAPNDALVGTQPKPTTDGRPPPNLDSHSLTGLINWANANGVQLPRGTPAPASPSNARVK